MKSLNAYATIDKTAEYVVFARLIRENAPIEELTRYIDEVSGGLPSHWVIAYNSWVRKQAN